MCPLRFHTQSHPCEEFALLRGYRDTWESFYVIRESAGLVRVSVSGRQKGHAWIFTLTEALIDEFSWMNFPSPVVPGVVRGKSFFIHKSVLDGVKLAWEISRHDTDTEILWEKHHQKSLNEAPWRRSQSPFSNCAIWGMKNCSYLIKP